MATTNADTVKAMYDAFGKQDIDTIVSHMADDVDWEYGNIENGVPFLKHRNGKDEVPGYFESLSIIEITKFEVKHVMASEDIVVSVLDVDYTVNDSGATCVNEDEIHVWYFNEDGKFVKFGHRVDTHNQVMVLKGEK